MKLRVLGAILAVRVLMFVLGGAGWLWWGFGGDVKFWQGWVEVMFECLIPSEIVVWMPLCLPRVLGFRCRHRRSISYAKISSQRIQFFISHYLVTYSPNMELSMLASGWEREVADLRAWTTNALILVI
jgi:hypothetical protein